MIEKILERLERYKKLRSDNTPYGIGVLNGYAEAIEIVKEESKNGGWIPCSERLPEEGEMVLVYDSLHDAIDVAEFLCPHWYARYGKMDEKITAWQPLPAPYQKGE